MGAWVRRATVPHGYPGLKPNITQQHSNSALCSYVCAWRLAHARFFFSELHQSVLACVPVLLLLFEDGA